MRIVWLASYPRSGNTWLRFLLAHYFFGSIESSLEVDRRIPNIHRLAHLDTERQGTALVKAHFLPSSDHPVFTETAAFVYVLRNPKDVLLSNYAYLCMTGALNHQDPRAFARDFIDHLGVSYWIENGIGPWVDHAKAWLAYRKHPGWVVTFEDLRANPLAELGRIVSFLGLHPREPLLRQAIAASEITQLRRLEEREKSAGGPTLFPGTSDTLHRGLRFINQGRSLQSLDSLEPGIDADFDRVFDRHMSEIRSFCDELRARRTRALLDPMVPGLEEDSATGEKAPHYS